MSWCDYTQPTLAFFPLLPVKSHHWLLHEESTQSSCWPSLAKLATQCRRSMGEEFWLLHQWLPCLTTWGKESRLPRHLACRKSTGKASVSWIGVVEGGMALQKAGTCSCCESRPHAVLQPWDSRTHHTEDQNCSLSSLLSVITKDRGKGKAKAKQCSLAFRARLEYSGSSDVCWMATVPRRSWSKWGAFQVRTWLCHHLFALHSPAMQEGKSRVHLWISTLKGSPKLHSLLQKCYWYLLESHGSWPDQPRPYLQQFRTSWVTPADTVHFKAGEDTVLVVTLFLSCLGKDTTLNSISQMFWKANLP